MFKVTLIDAMREHHTMYHNLKDPNDAIIKSTHLALLYGVGCHATVSFSEKGKEKLMLVIRGTDGWKDAK
jgi:hypothetical protein